VFCLVLSLLLRSQAIGMAFVVATGAALLVQLGVKWGVRRLCAPQHANGGKPA
jgi:hypothetical protein